MAWFQHAAFWRTAVGVYYQMSSMRLLKVVASRYQNHYFTKNEKQFFRCLDSVITAYCILKNPVGHDCASEEKSLDALKWFWYSTFEDSQLLAWLPRPQCGTCHLVNNLLAWWPCQQTSDCWHGYHANNLAKSPCQHIVGMVTMPTMKSLLAWSPCQQSGIVTMPTNCWHGNHARLCVLGGVHNDPMKNKLYRFSRYF